MKYLVAILVLALMASIPSLARACDLTASASGSGMQQIYDPFAPQNTVVVLQVSVFNAGDAPCVGRFFIAPQDGQLQVANAGQALAYRIEGANGGMLPGEFGPFLVNVPAGQSETVSIQFTVQSQQVVPPGFYTSLLTLRGEAANDAAIPIGGSVPVITIAVPARSEIGISGVPSPILSSGGMAPATISFPDAQAGQTERVFVNVWANSSVRVQLTSENGGVLKHMQDPSLPAISYTATFDGVALALGGAQSVSRTPPMSIQGASYELAITLGETAQKFAGRYRDRITVDVNAN